MALLDTLQGQGFYKFKSLPSTEMRTDFKDFEHYLQSLDKAKRSDLRRKFRQTDGRITLAMEVTNRLDGAILDEAYGLFCQTEARSDTQFEKLPKEFFFNIAKNMPHEARFFLWRIRGKLAAFYFCLSAGDRLHGHYVGFDYTVAHRYHLFFTRFRDLIHWCVANKISRYEMGSTCYSAKKTLGFKLLPLYVYAKHLRPRMNPFFHLLCKMLKPENFEDVMKTPRAKS